MLVEIDGRAADAAALRHRALVNHGHFTAMQVRGGRVRGLHLHLGRLVAASRELFDADLDPSLVQRLLRHALRDADAAAVRVDVHQPDGELSVMVTVRPPTEPASTPQRLRTVRYERPFAEIKHVGTFAQIQLGREAERDGFDDALLTGPDGAFRETTIANIGFVTDDPDDTVCWPDGSWLPGTTWQLLDRDLPGRGVRTTRRTVRVADLPDLRAGFLTNSRGVVPVAAIDGIGLRVDHPALDVITAAYQAVPWDLV